MCVKSFIQFHSIYLIIIILICLKKNKKSFKIKHIL